MSQDIQKITVTYREAAKILSVSAESIPLLVEAGLIKPLLFKRPKISIYEMKRFAIDTASAGIDIESKISQLKLNKKSEKIRGVG